MFTMLALLKPGAPDVPLDTVIEKVQALFGGDSDFRWEYETLPFQPSRNIILRWIGWSARLFCEADESVRHDAVEIARILGKSAPAGVADSTRRVRAVFHDDPDELHIDDMVEIMSMLEKIEGAVVFDPQQNKLMD